MTRRTPPERKADTLELLERQGHGWLATSGGPGRPHLIVVAATWDGTDFVVATRGGTPTARNLEATRVARLALGSPDDVVMVDLEVVAGEAATKDASLAGRFVTAAGWDPADEGADWRYYRLRPSRIDAYRGYGELEGREVMRDGRWRA